MGAGTRSARLSADAHRQVVRVHHELDQSRHQEVMGLPRLP
jgi:hypothetical protein